jgi:hypothetical protein
MPREYMSFELGQAFIGAMITDTLATVIRGEHKLLTSHPHRCIYRTTIYMLA